MEKKDYVFLAKWKIYVILAAVLIGFLIETEVLFIVRKKALEKNSLTDEEQTEYQLANITRIANPLVTFYEELRIAYGPSGWAGSTTEQEAWDKMALFASYLAMHDIGKFSWLSYDTTYYNLTGEHTYDTANRILTETLDLLQIASSDSDQSKIEHVLSFLDSYITYTDDFNDTFHAPVETLSYRSGDCDDFTILCAALFEKLNIESGIGLFECNETEAHMMVLVKLDSLFGYDFYSFSDLTAYGLNSGQWIIIEPQALIEDQHDSWISQWSLVSTAGLDYP